MESDLLALPVTEGAGRRVVGLVRRSKYFLGEEVFRQELTAHTVYPASQAARVAEEREVKKAISGINRGSEFRTRRDRANQFRRQRSGHESTACEIYEATGIGRLVNAAWAV